MLNRQKVLLALLQQADKPLAATVFVKLAFLLRQETNLRRDHTFYDFVPYRYGPFSFTLYREVAGLRQNGYLSPDETRVQLCPRTHELVQKKTAELPGAVLEAIGAVVKQYGKLSQRALLRNVYSNYPWYASKSELADPDVAVSPRTAAEPAAYTIGYQGRSVDAFFNRLLELGIEVIIDVRATPASRKYGFSKRSLREIGAKLGIEYRHMPSLGVPAEHRTGLGSQASYERLLNLYEREILPERREEVSEVAEFMQRRPAVLLCMERDAGRCHRGRLAAAVSRASGLGVVHL